MSALNRDQFLPGTEHIKPAEPHEQTEDQFHNRPDVFVHGRYTHERNDLAKFGVVAGKDFHAGTRRAAHDRLHHLEAPDEGYQPRFFYGRVDPAQMQNTPAKGRWEKQFPGPGKDPWNLPKMALSRDADPGRIPDQMESWSQRHHDRYYRNDYEDPGSTSVILRTEDALPTIFGNESTPVNFKTWRDSVGSALAQGKQVPAHVRGQYEATGGARGYRHVADTSFQTPAPTATKYAKFDSPLSGLQFDTEPRPFQHDVNDW